MKILKKSFKKYGEGYVRLCPVNDEDLWHLYNLIHQGDHIKMKTKRKVIDDSNASGLKKISKKTLTLTLMIVEIDYFAEGDKLAISVKGRNAEQNEFLKMGQYHTFRIEEDLPLTIYKEMWMPYEMSLIKDLSHPKFGTEIGAMVMEEGVAHICYVKPEITLLKQKIQKNVSKKGAGDDIYQKSLGKFFEECWNGIKSVDFTEIKCFVLASPGFINEQFFKYMKVALEKC